MFYTCQKHKKITSNLLILRNQEAHKCHNTPNESTCQTTNNPVLKTAKLLQEHPKMAFKAALVGFWLIYTIKATTLVRGPH